MKIFIGLAFIAIFTAELPLFLDASESACIPHEISSVEDAKPTVQGHESKKHCQTENCPEQNCLTHCCHLHRYTRTNVELIPLRELYLGAPLTALQTAHYKQPFLEANRKPPKSFSVSA